MAGSSKSADGTDAAAEAVEDAVILPDPEVIPDPEPIVPEPVVPEPVVARPAPAPLVVRRNGGFVPLALGGVVAAALGFGAAQYVPDGWPIGTDPEAQAAAQTAVDAALAAQTARSDALAADLAALAAKPAEVDPADLTARVEAVQAALAEQQTATEARLTTLADSLAALDGRTNVLERRPVAGGAASDTALSAYEDEIKALRAMVEAQQAQSSSAGSDIAAMAAQAKTQLDAAVAQAAELQAQAEATGRAAAASAALSRVQAALDAGGSFATALDVIEASGGTVPEGLRAQAAGVLTVQQLQAAFADPARAALAASLKATLGTGTMERVGAFLRSQIGARSLTAHDGADPDAILSRAEAAVKTGDLTAALAEIASLPAEGQAEMAAWVGLAQTRMAAQADLETLTASLNK